MGSNNSVINITFDRTQSTIYYAGGVISGHVQITGSERLDTIDDIYLTVTGDIGYTTTRTTRMQNGQTDRKTDRHDIRIYGERVLVDEIVTLEPGRYMCPFSIRLPNVLPPTIHPIDYPFVRYELQVKIIHKNFFYDLFNLK
jgi:sporulation-control protein spo0M